VSLRQCPEFLLKSWKYEPGNKRAFLMICYREQNEKRTLAKQNLLKLWTTFFMAEKVGKKLANGQILFQKVPIRKKVVRLSKNL
tara:strand:+ start:170 stop:421 length:252 start_codon:yes stop_codon:yes gene_type:complete